MWRRLLACGLDIHVEFCRGAHKKRRDESRRGRLTACATIAGLTCAVAAFAQQQVVTFHSDVDSSDQPYAIYVPHSLDRTRTYPLVIDLHMEDVTYVQAVRQMLQRNPDLGMIVACPLARGSMGYRGIAGRDVYDMLSDVMRRWPVDEDRIYLTGASMGGGGALWLGLTRPDVWAAISPIAAEAPPGIESLAGNALDVPVLLFHGEQDPLIPAASSRQWQKRFLQQGVRAEYIEYPLLRHNAWDKAYRDGGLFDWFAKFKRERFPTRVRFTTSAYKYDRAYWVHLDRLTPGTIATIDAHLTGPDRIEVATKNLDGFTLNLAKPPAQVSIDGAVLRPKNRTAVSFIRTANGWMPGSAPIPAGQKRPGLEGPIGEAIASRHIYVYGTTGESAARQAAEWSTPRAHLTVSFACKADKDVTDKDLAESNLILFGTRATNTLIARFARQFPIALSPSAADYGLVFVAPVGNRYVVVNSGLPWWTGGERTPPFRLLEGFGDYVLFKGSLDHVVAQGRFDRNWKLPPTAAQQMIETGAVEISSCCQKSFADSAMR
jgi:hypothetical protein